MKKRKKEILKEIVETEKRYQENLNTCIEVNNNIYI